MKKAITKKGFGLIEVVASIGIASILILSFIAIVKRAALTQNSSIREFHAQLYASEGLEVFRDLERSNWTHVSGLICTESSPCHLSVSSGAWTVIPGNEVSSDGIYTRKIIIDPIYRSASSFPNNIVSTPGVLDPDSRKVTVVVNWYSGLVDREIVLSTYIHNYGS